ncbi:type IV secretion protein Rhs [Kibdelosporangium philippinense]|uniref:Type IV secretion protein Rhs n=1 Tax=Kibdelosporangium philippinense TaxID=211113 RepID=A0ABS8ZNG3_9PSEU|nr:polymorphic toxin-type HINT domain-containing protein [Kibdelosporangium philippinense]MCE7009269.1 type IV secretion protein Rhs [Kibdelosporangium philippinense]
MASGRQRRAFSGMSLWMTMVTAATVVTGLAGPAFAATDPDRPVPQQMKPIPHKDFPLRPAAAPRVSDVPAPRQANWPAAGEADVDLDQARGSTAQRAGALPVFLGGGSGTARVRIADQEAGRRAGVAGVMLSVTLPQATSVGVDYSGFGESMGAGFGSRLRLVALPDCALTTPDKPECRVQTPLVSNNDPGTRVVTADISPQGEGNPVVVAAVGGPGGSQGQFVASSLAPSGSWSVTGASGGFRWTYPIDVPPVATGGAPGISLAYSSTSVDGRTAATNNQGSFIGQGWDYSPGYVERSYRSCSDDTALPKEKQTGDLCWAGNIVTMNLAGATTALVRDDATGVWRAESDSNAKIELKSGVGNGARDGEHWKVTTPDGTQYFFGLRPEAASTWTAPVYGPHPGNPCYNSDFAKASCTQAWRWNLDYVVSTLGGATAYYYNAETNHYGVNMKTNSVLYTRGGTLKRIDYGMRDTGSGIAGQRAPGQVTFDTTERCDPAIDPKVNCSDPAHMTPKNALSWPDVPVDQQCKQGETCNNHSPTFWTTRKLTTITTWYDTGSGPVKVDSYALNQTLPGLGYGDRELRLDSIVRTGFAPDGTSVTMPPISFTSQLFDNRVLGHQNLPAMAHWRLTNIAGDTGTITNVTYSRAECTKDTVPADPSTNDKMCYPVKWNPPYFKDVTLDWFHKYVVTEIQVQDRNGISPTQVTNYTYLGKPAWHFDDNELVKPAHRTYGQFRGYEKVEVRSGNTQNTVGGVPDKRTLTRTTYFRGMDGDIMPNNGRRPAKVRDSFGTELPDNDLYAGQAREVETFNGDGGPRLSTELTEHTTVATTATRNRPGLSPLLARVTAPSKTQSFTHLAAGGTRKTSTTTRYDSAGRPVAATTSGDGVPDLCATTRYADNTENWIRSKPKEVITSQEACPAGDPTPRLILSVARTYYDGSSELGVVTRGLPSKTERATGNQQGKLTFAVLSTVTSDPLGRTLTSTDADGNVTTTAYTPAEGGIVSQTVVTNPKNQTASTQYEPSRGKTIAAVDVAGLRTDAVYDPLGRLVAVWKPGQTKGFDDATAKYEYTLRLDGPLAVTSKALVDHGKGRNYVTAINLYDAFGLLRQTQTDVEAGGRAVKDTFYDSHGWARISNNRYYTNGAASTTLVQVADSAVDDRTVVTYDGSGRPERSTAYKGLQATWETRTIHGGDRTTVLPPQGGVASTTVNDVRGKMIELHRHTTPPAVDGNGHVTGGAPEITKYSYTATGQQESITDAANATWTYRYDFLGRKISQTDPDTGTSTIAYDALDRISSTTDARNQTLTYAYDALGRKVAVHDGPVTGPTLSEWTWDTLQAGKLTSSTRHTPKGDYVSATTGYNGMGLPRGNRTTIPAGETGLAGTYLTRLSFTSTGLPSTIQPAYAGGLPDEIIRTEYDTFGQPKVLWGDFDYVSDTTYTPYGETGQFALSSLDNSAWLTYAYDPQTRRLTGQNLSVRQAEAQISDLQYTYDPAGNPTKSVETRGPVGALTPIRTQCYQYDSLNRLSQAWTAKDNCANAPGAANVGGPNPYWTSWTFETSGLRKQQTKHAVPGNPGGDSVTSYTYPVGAKQPHTLTGTSTTGARSGSTSYTYDASGNTVTRAVPTGNQTLTWDKENRLATVTSPAGETSYVYDADGGQLIRRDPGKTVLYLPGQELALDTKTGTVTGTRYYTHGGKTVALRVGSTGNPKYLLNDLHGTGQVAVDSVGFAVTRRDHDAYGNNLGDVQGGPWPDQRGFLGKPTSDATGLTDIGARKYDPVTGRFISADPIMRPTSPAELNGYTYSGNNPVTFSDPTGEYCDSCDFYSKRDNTYSDWNEPPTSDKAPTSLWGDIDRQKRPKRRPGSIVSIGGRNVPSFKQIKELKPMGHGYADDEHDLAVTDWAKKSCSGNLEQNGDFCAAARDEGLLGPNDPELHESIFGLLPVVSTVVDGVKCVQGKGSCGKALFELPQITKVAKIFGPLIRGMLSKGCSFAAGTLVLMADGTYKRIEELHTGDIVLATDPETGETGPRVVTAVMAHDDTVLELATEDGATVTTTEDHPFYNATDREWQRADQLDHGDLLFSVSGQQVRVRSLLTDTARTAVAYDFTVSDLHTYYVLAGNTPVLVHNCGGIDDATHGRIQDTYGNDIADGVDYNVQRMCPNCNSASDAADHSINGIGGNVDGLAIYLTGQRDLGMTHVDGRKPGTTARRDETRKDSNGRGVTVVQNSYMVHAYHQSLEEFNSIFNPM